MIENYAQWIHEHKNYAVRFCFFALLLIGIMVRIWEFGIVPGDINQDEAFAGYEAYSLLHYGIDSSGYAFPVYFTAWGSGMNALEIYLMIPFTAVLGLNTFAIRLPQVIIACITLWVIFLLARKIFPSYLCFIVLFLTAVSPWHIMLSRWGLESNLTPAFLIFGLYFFVLGSEKPGYFIISAVFYGLSLYCYATIWLIVPFILSLQAIYCILYRKIHFCREIVISVFILLIFAFPLILFLLINQGILPEIKTPFFSIPKLAVMRSSEVSLHKIKSNFANLCTILLYQSDNYIVNSTGHYGVFYHITLPFFLIGLFHLLYDIAVNCKRRLFDPGIFIIINFTAAFTLGLLIQTNLTKINSLFLPMIIITSYGLYKISLRFNKLFIILLIAYSISFLFFTNYYFTDYKDEVKNYFYYGSEDMLEQAHNFQRKIYITKNLSYPVVLFYNKENVNSYIDTVQYSNYPNAFLDVDSFTDYSFVAKVGSLDPDALYLLDNSYDTGIFTDNGYEIIDSDGIFYLAVKY